MDILFDDKIYLFERTGYLAIIPTEYLEELSLRQTPRSQRQSAYYVKEYLEWCERNAIAWNRATASDMMSFSQSLPVDLGAHNRKIDRVCDFYRFAEAHGVPNPTTRFIIRDQGPRSFRSKRNLLHRKVQRVASIEVPEVAEIGRFLACLTHSRNRLIADVMYESGMRLGEVLSLRRDRLLAVRGSAKGAVSCEVTGKGNKRRRVILGVAVWSRLITYAQASAGEWVFSADGTRPLSADTVQVAFRKASKLSGVPVHPHMLRHAYASQWLHAVTLLTKKPVAIDANLKVLQALLGHNSLDTTSIYLHTVNHAEAAKLRTDVQASLNVMRGQAA